MAGIVVASLLVVVVVLTIGDFFVSNTGRNLTFCLVPSFRQVGRVNVTGAVANTVGRTFFALDLKVNTVTVLKDCVKGRHSLLNRSMGVTVLSAFITVASKLVVFPTYFAFRISRASKPDLVFVALPGVFGRVPLNEL